MATQSLPLDASDIAALHNVEYDPDTFKPTMNPSLDFIAGTVSGTAALVVGYPFDTVKVRSQTIPLSPDMKLGTFRTILTILRQERLSGTFKGIGAPLCTLPLLNGLVFSSYKLFMGLQVSSSSYSTQHPTLSMIFLAGCGSGIVSSAITTPIELIKIRQQAAQSLTHSPTSTPSALSTGLQILRTEGLGTSGLYRGMGTTVCRELGYGWYFFAYEFTNRILSPVARRIDPKQDSTLLSWGVLLTAGGLAGIAGWLFTFPFDVIKTRIQSTTHSTTTAASLSPNPYRNLYTTALHSYRTEGARVFFKGLWPTLVRSVPVNMVTFGTFEAIVSIFS